MAIEVTVQLPGVAVNVETDATYSPDVVEDLLRRVRESATAVYDALPDAAPDLDEDAQA